MRTLLVMLCFAFPSLPVLAAERMAVYLPGTREARDIQKSLNADPVLKDVTASAFARFEDFTFSLESDKYEFAILPSVAPRHLSGFEPVLQFTAGGSSTFKYSVISIDSRWDKTRLGEGIAGIVDEVGRKNIKAHVKSLMAGHSFKRIKQVGKVIDLFPMLSLGNVDYILIAPHELEALKKDFTTRTYKVVDSIEVNHPVLCVKSGTDIAKAKKFGKLLRSTLNSLGFDGVVEIAK